VSTTLASPGKYVQLEQGEKIPWQGWCFDGQAMAELVASKELAEQKCELYTMQELEQQQAKFDLQIGQLQASMQYEVQTRDVAIQSLQEENLKIEEALIHQTKYGWIAPSAFGFVVGALTIFLVTL
jgi:hypothetical protein